ncbi:MAG: fumarate reductase (quinol) flavoprotein subunit, partial [Proteobacteria bacterium]|nr:fumarate reductase (quinol) flavoprotein subunit [Pseudomonadota bacterium]
AGLRAAIAAAQDPAIRIALISKVYRMRSHTCAAEDGAAGAFSKDDSFELHFRDTVSGGDWLCDQDVVEYFVERAPRELIDLEHWGCPWSRQASGEICLRNFGGMKVPRTWFAADRSGFHILHTLYQASVEFKNIQRLDEHFAIDLLEDNGRICGVLTYDLLNGIFRAVLARSVIIASGGAAQAYQFTTNATIVTGDGMSLAFRHGVPLRDMEFIQYHPTGLPGSGLLITEAARGEGGVLLNKDGYRYLQDYDLGKETPLGCPKRNTMELGPRDRLSEAFWHEQKKGRTISSQMGDVVHLDLRHIGKEKLQERLPQICELARTYVGVDPANAPIPVRPVVHYTMGGIETNIRTETRIPGLYAAGECASIGLHGANRLGSNSLTEILVFGHVAGEEAARFAKSAGDIDEKRLTALAQETADHLISRLTSGTSDDSAAAVRKEMAECMEQNVGIYREESAMAMAVETLRKLQARYKDLRLTDTKGRVFNYELVHLLELGYTLDVAECIAKSALERKESRGSHQRLDGPDAEWTKRDDTNFLKHTLAFHKDGQTPEIQYSDVVITKFAPAKRVYGSENNEVKDTHESKA